MTDKNDDLFIKVKAARKQLPKTPNSYYVVSSIAARLQQYASDNRFGAGEIVDMAFLEFLERRGINLRDISPVEIEESPDIA